VQLCQLSGTAQVDKVGFSTPVCLLARLAFDAPRHAGRASVDARVDKRRRSRLLFAEAMAGTRRRPRPWLQLGERQ